MKVEANIIAEIAQPISINSDELYAGLQHATPVTSQEGDYDFYFGHDCPGERKAPHQDYDGRQTLRAIKNFPFSGIRICHYQHFVRALACIKKAAALANAELGRLERKISDAIAKACDEILAGKRGDQFIADMIEGEGGVSTNTNANQVIANRALELLGHAKGSYQFCHPTDHVNCSQSTTHVYQTAIKLGVWFTLGDTLRALRELQAALQTKAEEFANEIKIDGTEIHEAMSATLGQQFGAFAVLIGNAIRNLENAGHGLFETNMGATVMGLGLNNAPGYLALYTKKLAEISGAPVWLPPNVVKATFESGKLAPMSSVMKTVALQLSKICNDLICLSSGTRFGNRGIRLTAVRPGASIIPSKVNPSVPELVNEICFQIIGNDVTISMACAASEPKLNMSGPIIVFNLFSGLTLLQNAALALASRCITDLELNRERTLESEHQAAGRVTELSPGVGHKKPGAIDKQAHKTGATVYDLVARGWLTKDKLAALLKSEQRSHLQDSTADQSL